MSKEAVRGPMQAVKVLAKVDGNKATLPGLA